MAKKIVSILCALAMLATMVTVGMVSAFAGEGDTGSETGTTKAFGGLNKANATYSPYDPSLGSATVETKSGFYSNLPGYGDSLIAMYYGVQTISNVKYPKAGSIVTDAIGTYNIGSSFNFSFDVATNLQKISDDDNAGSWSVSLGDLSITLSHTKSANKLALEVKKGEEVISATEGDSSAISKYTPMRKLSGQIAELRYDPDNDNMRKYSSDAFVEFWRQTGLANSDIRSPIGLPRTYWNATKKKTYYMYYVPAENTENDAYKNLVVYSTTKPWSTATPVFYKDGNCTDKYDAANGTPVSTDVCQNWFVYASHVNVEYNNGMLTVSVTDYEGKNRAAIFTYDLTDVYGADSLGKTRVTAKVTAPTAPNSAKSSGMTVGMCKFTGEYTESTTVINEGQSINLLDSDHINNWSVTTTNSSSCYAGAVNLTGQGLEGVVGVLALNKSTSSYSQRADFTYADAIDFGSDFSILMTAFIKTNLGTKEGSTPPTVTEDTYVSLALGDYSIRLVRFTEDAATESTTSYDRCNFRIALYYDKTETLLAVTDKIDSDTKTDLYGGKPYSTTTPKDVGLLNGVVSDVIAAGCPRTSDNTSTTKVAYAKDSGWKDITITVKDGELSVSLVNNTICKFAVSSNPNVDVAEDVTSLTESNFNTSSFVLSDLGITSFDGVAPVVHCYNDGALMKSQPSAVFRLEAVINPDIKPAGANATVDSAISANMLFTPEQVTAWETQGYTDVTVIAKVNGVAKQTISKFDDMYAQDKTGTVKLYKAAKFNFLTPDLYGTTVEYVVSATKGNTTSTYTKQYSIKDYCVNQMKDCHDFLALEGDQLVAALVEAGLVEEETSATDAKVTAYQDKATKLGKLCMSILQFAEAERAWASGAGLSDVTTPILTEVDKTTYGDFVTSWTEEGNAEWSYGDETYEKLWVKTNLNFKDEIGFSFYFTLPADAKSGECYVVNGGTTYDNLTPATANGTACYNVVARISATQLNEQFIFVIRQNSEQVSKSYTLSVKDWVLANLALEESKFSADKKECVRAMMAYGDAAQAYAEPESSNAE